MLQDFKQCKQTQQCSCTYLLRGFALLCSILFCSVLFYSSLFYSIPAQPSPNQPNSLYHIPPYRIPPHPILLITKHLSEFPVLQFVIYSSPLLGDLIVVLFGTHSIMFFCFWLCKKVVCTELFFYASIRKIKELCSGNREWSNLW